MSRIGQGPSIDVQTFIDSQRLSAFQYLVIFLCFVIVALDGFDTAAIGFIAPALREDWGLSNAQLNPVLVASLFGLGLGAFASGPLADRFGRKKVLIGSVLIFGGWCLASAFADSVTSLSVLRFLTGLGLGAAMPNAVTLTAEYCPQRRRSLIVTVMFCGFTLGSAFGGIVSAWLVPNFGWHSVLLTGGLLPLLSVPLLLLCLPESARFLAQRPGNELRIVAILRRIGPLPLNAVPALPAAADEAAPAQDRSPVRLILSPAQRNGTLLLWGTFFMSMLIIALLTSWLPTLIGETGHGLDDAARIAAMFQFGGTLGAILLGAFMDRLNPYLVLSLSYLGGALFIAAIGTFYADYSLLVLSISGIGFCISGGQVGANALAASYYPTSSRATGVSWALGVGRIGSIFGSLAGGSLLGMGLGFQSIFYLLTIPAFVASAMVLLMGLLYGRAAAPTTHELKPGV
ncbi:MFS transporter [Pseudomonas aeruginosa]|uniref:MFS transporter n=1 Tax=Pseudomonas aeruginosa TaxID=287 RepID=UPI003FD43644